VLALIKQRLSELEAVCPTLEVDGYRYPTKGGDGGDDCLWLGLLSSVGVESAATGVSHCQRKGGPNAGMFYRNSQRETTGNAGHGAIFSRDMALGVLTWIASYGGSETDMCARMWLDWITRSRPCTLKKPKWLGSGCLVRGLYRYAPDADGRSNITPAMWAIMGRVWEYRNYKPNRLMRMFKGADGDLSVAEAMVCDLGYQLHLKAVQAYIKILTRQSSEYRQRVSKICHDRIPQNLFYKILSQEGVEEEDLKTFLQIMPNPLTFVPRDYWIWEKGDYEDALAQQKMCGWDIVFLGRLIIQLSDNT